jgi:hypothetical protein
MTVLQRAARGPHPASPARVMAATLRQSPTSCLPHSIRLRSWPSHCPESVLRGLKGTAHQRREAQSRRHRRIPSAPPGQTLPVSIPEAGAINQRPDPSPPASDGAKTQSAFLPHPRNQGHRPQGRVSILEAPWPPGPRPKCDRSDFCRFLSRPQQFPVRNRGSRSLTARIPKSPCSDPHFVLTLLVPLAALPFAAIPP